MPLEIQRGSFKAVLYDKSIRVNYRGVWCDTFFLQRPPTDDDVRYLECFAKDLYEAGRQSIKDELKELLK